MDPLFLLLTVRLHCQFSSLPLLSRYIFNRLSAQILSWGPTKTCAENGFEEVCWWSYAGAESWWKSLSTSVLVYGWIGEAATAPRPHSQKWDAVISSKKDILSAHMRLEQNQLIRCILWGLNDDLRVMIFNGCLHIAKENPSALQNQARG